MHYYRRNIGDYAKKAGRLSMLEHGAYTLVMDACYDRERFPTLDEALDWTWARSPEEEQAVKFVLNKFFMLDEQTGTYIQKRIARELEDYKIAGIINQLIALAREARRKKNDGFAEACDELKSEIKHDPSAKTHAAYTRLLDDLINKHERGSTVQDRAPNHKPITNNHKPITNNQEPKNNRRFTPPTIEEVSAYCRERCNQVSPENFIDHYQANGWMRGNTKIKDWKACVRTWEKNSEQNRPNQSYPKLSLAKRTEEQTRELQARIAAGEFDQCSLGQDDTDLPAQVDFSRGREDGGGQIDGKFFDVVPKNGVLN